MSRISSTNNVMVVEIDGRDTPYPYPVMVVKNHWNNRDLVVLVDPGGKSITVSADDLRKAIANATNV